MNTKIVLMNAASQHLTISNLFAAGEGRIYPTSTQGMAVIGHIKASSASGITVMEFDNANMPRAENTVNIPAINRLFLKRVDSTRLKLIRPMFKQIRDLLSQTLFAD